MSLEFLWYVPNQVDPGHRGDDAIAGHNSLERLTELARLTEQHGWGGALLGTLQLDRCRVPVHLFTVPWQPVHRLAVRRRLSKTGVMGNHRVR